MFALLTPKAGEQTVVFLERDVLNTLPVGAVAPTALFRDAKNSFLTIANPRESSNTVCVISIIESQGSKQELGGSGGRRSIQM